MEFEPTRPAGLKRLADFQPRAGRLYSDKRNFDDGRPTEGARRNVSQLSPWLKAGLLSETETIHAAVRAHGFDACEKFVAEVFWRVYFKGYLEQRPTIWSAYLGGLNAARTAKSANRDLAAAYAVATEGRTGIEAFDCWVRELVETGYLHNHARMWFASIWTFTLKLDWHLGADFFLRHLIDGDAASNTLSWRWVGGLHTKGKTYAAHADNIARFTMNQPGGPLSAAGLAKEAPALEELDEHSLQPLSLPAAPTGEALERPYALILHDDGAHHAPLELAQPPSLVIGAARPNARSPSQTSSLAADFANNGVESGVAAAAEAFGCQAVFWQPGQELACILESKAIERAAYSFLPVGWTRDALMQDLTPLIEHGRAIPILSDLDRATWPLAKAGFFGLRKKIASILDEVGISDSAIANGTF